MTTVTEPSRASDNLALSIMQHTNGNSYFGLLVDDTVRKLRAAMAAPKPGVDALTDAEFEAARLCLDKFRAEYEQAYADLFLRHVDAGLLPEIASVLGTKPMLAYFTAVSRMDCDLPKLFEELGARMFHHARYRSAA